jgi:hypothetical protein
MAARQPDWVEFTRLRQFGGQEFAINIDMV